MTTKNTLATQEIMLYRKFKRGSSSVRSKYDIIIIPPGLVRREVELLQYTDGRYNVQKILLKVD